MKIKKWIAIYIGGLFLAAAIVVGYNVIVDPFGVFRDKEIKSDSYNMVNNPRITKIAYLDEHYKKYDSYIIGGSKSSSISPELLNEYYGDASFYSMMMSDGDFNNYENTVKYLINHYEVKNIVLHMSLQELGHYKDEATSFKQSLHGKVNDDNLIVKQEQEDITGIDEFIENNPNFEASVGQIQSVALDKNVESLKRIKEVAEAHNVNFTFITGATYKSELSKYNLDDLKTYWRKIADVTPFWDFTGYTAISNDPRYFYDSMHYRNNVGEMMLAYIFNDENKYVPENFGHYTTVENVDEHANKVFTPSYYVDNGDERTVPILMYHHISDNPSELNTLTVSPEKFEQDMLTIKNAGYTPVHLSELVDFVYKGTSLPEKPIVITFDDGYTSNYKFAYPTLQQLNMKATIFMIGWSVGKSEHRIPGTKFYPHFSWIEGKEMVDSGLIELQNHTYDMHDGKDAERYAALPKVNESPKQFEQFFKEDILKFEQLAEEQLQHEIFALAYPYGAFTTQTEQMLKDLGYKVTLTTQKGVNVINQGNPNELHALKRINVGSDVPSTSLLTLIEQK
jgi:peptidoglycan/xylan/chitin deacetylase (PgdA/CDA1 family)